MAHRISTGYRKRHRSAARHPSTEAALLARAASPEHILSHNLTVFRCVNCSPTGTTPTPASRLPPAHNESGRPFAVHEVALPCTGKLQPEHLLKAFEAGADAVCVIDCADDGCLYLEGSRRAERRAEYVGKLLDEIGLGAQRLMLFHLDGPDHAAAIYETVAARLATLPPSPLRRDGPAV